MEPEKASSLLSPENAIKNDNREKRSINSCDLQSRMSQPSIIPQSPWRKYCHILIDYAVFAIFYLVYFIVDYRVSVHHQCIPGNVQNANPSDCAHLLNNTKTPLLDFPLRTAQVPIWYTYVFGAAHWLFIILISLCLLRPKLKDFKFIFCKLEALFRKVLVTVMLSQLVVVCVKNYIGRPRPNYYNYWPNDTPDAISSFPSGHSSSTFCIQMLLIYHVVAAMRWSQAPDVQTHFVRNDFRNIPVHYLFGAMLWQKTRNLNGLHMLVIGILMVWPLFVCCTRIYDYYHHYDDVLCGAALGTLFASIGFAIFDNQLCTGHQRHNQGNYLTEPLLNEHNVKNAV